MSRLASRATALRIVIGRLIGEVRELIGRVFRTGECLRAAGRLLAQAFLQAPAIRPAALAQQRAVVPAWAEVIDGVQMCPLLCDEGAQIRGTEIAQGRTPQLMHSAHQMGRVSGGRHPSGWVQLVERAVEVQQMVHAIHSQQTAGWRSPRTRRHAVPVTELVRWQAALGGSYVLGLPLSYPRCNVLDGVRLMVCG